MADTNGRVTNASLHKEIGRLEGRVDALTHEMERLNKSLIDMSAKQDADDETVRKVLNQLVGRGQMAVWFFSALMAVGGLLTAVYNVFAKP